jgi:3',5'-cyclic AMP phosphodiesterase CpdA
MEEKKELKISKLNPNIIKAAMVMTMRMSIPNNEKWLAYINRRIDNIRAIIISGNVTENGMNELLDELQRLTIEKRDTESLIGSLKHMKELGKKLDEKDEIEMVPISEVHGKLKELVNKNEES